MGRRTGSQDRERFTTLQKMEGYWKKRVRGKWKRRVEEENGKRRSRRGEESKEGEGGGREGGRGKKWRNEGEGGRGGKTIQLGRWRNICLYLKLHM